MTRARFSAGPGLALALFVLPFVALSSSTGFAADLTTVTIDNTTSSAQSNVPVTFGQVFKPGDVPAGATLGARVGTTTIPLQVDKKATHADGSLRHGVLTAVLPSLPASGSQVVTLTNTGAAPGGTAPTPAALLATTFDANVSLNIGGTAYTASARTLLQSGTPATWLAGPLAREWILSAPVRTASGAAHPHLQARFYVRAYEGLQRVRVEAVVENNWAFEAGPRNYTYNLTVNVAGRGAVYTQNSVNHYRQSRWRRVVWWGTQPSYSVRHDRTYLMATRAVPSYDTRVQVSSNALNGWLSGLGTNPGVMSIGDLEPNMPSPGGRFEIAPLPAFQAAFILSQDDRARRATIGYGEQAGAWPMHYRDKTTDQPPTLDANPNLSILGGSGIFGNFPACGGTCSTGGLLPEASHHPSLAYLPYLITGDYYLMEELVMWGNWVLFYGESSRHGGAQGLVVWDQVRGQAWALRTLTEAAYLTPDSHPLKSYLKAKLQNNITYFRNNWVDSNPLGYVTNTGAANWLGLDDWIASWMDDFLTYAFGRMVAMGFSEAQPVLAWKAKFPVGRLTDPNMCWVLASSYWPYVRGDRYAGGSSAFVTNWTDWRRNVIFGWNNDAFRGTNDIGGQEQALFNAQCGSATMMNILGVGSGQMIGWDGPDAYPANLQAAAAVAVEAGVANAQQAWSRLTTRGGYPLSGYGSQPQWAIFPASGGGTAPAPSVQLNANPASISSGQSSTLSWSSSNATSCTASGGWAGNKAVSGSQSVGPLTATTDFTLTCTGAGGSGSDTARVTVGGASAPTLTFSANPTTVASGGSSTLTWSSTNATSCTASNGWSGSRLTSGTASTGALTANRTYVLTCTGSGGSVQRSASVSVQASTPAPTLTLTASPKTVPFGGASTVTWNSANATGCTASGSWSGSRATSGSQSFTGITTNRTYTLQCTGPGGNVSRSATVTAYNAAGSPVIDFDVTPATIGQQQRATLSWSVANATSCFGQGAWSGSRPLQGSQQTAALTSSQTYTLTCSGSGGWASERATVAVDRALPTCPTGQTCPPPAVTFTATPSNVAVAGNVTLQWNATNAQECEASGGWSGIKATSGSQTIRNLRSGTVFTITCPGVGSRARVSRTVTVGSSAPPAPTVTLSANPTTVASGGGSMLTWSSTGATSCTASGGWNGSRPTSGSQAVSGIQATTIYALACTGAGGTASDDATVTVSGSSAALSGAVDSSYIDRFGDNRIYVFAGNVTPDDIDGSGVEPLTTIPVAQDANACSFGYARNGLGAGTYTIAFTQDAGQDVPGSSQNLVFVGTRQVTVSGSGVASSFRPSNILTVGPGKQYATLRAAQLAAVAGSVIEIDAGTYVDDVTVWRQNGVTIRGVGGRAHIQGNRRIPFVSGDDRNNGMGLMVVRGTGISVENIEFSGARVDDLNGAGIRNQGSNLSICNGYFHDNEDGFLGGAYGTLLFEYSEFANNGFGDPGRNHNVYVDDGERLVFRNNYSHHAQVGHTLKTRAAENHILYNRIMDETTGNSSYTIDVPNGGLTFVVGNLLQQGPNTENSALMNYGTEGLSGGRTHQLYLVNNSFVNDRGSGSFLQYQGGTALVRTINNLFVGGGSVPGGGVVQATTNLTTNAPGFVNENGFDYRLTTGSPAINAGTAPGSAQGMSLAPAYQYVHRARRENRATDSRIDIGAYEFVP